MDNKIPWNRQEIFHDEIDQFPLFDYFPYLAKESSAGESSADSSNQEGV
ncbi:MAG: hypothetical protein GX893_03905 [Firmicutes bacterium]|nr:hypothetical protein [Bacillota bacterium]